MAFVVISATAAFLFATDEAFQVAMRLVSPVQITETRPLTFTATLIGTATDLAVAAGDPGAAVFGVEGEPGAGVTGSVVERQVILAMEGSAEPSRQIVVDTFVLGGDMAASGAAALDVAGRLDNLRIGGTAHVEPDDEPGTFAGGATFRLVYQ